MGVLRIISADEIIPRWGMTSNKPSSKPTHLRLYRYQGIPLLIYSHCGRRYGGDCRPRGFSCRDQFLCLAFAQLTFRESLRDIETCLRAVKPKLYHAGFRGKIARSTLPMPTALTTGEIRRLCSSALGQARKLSAEEPFGVDLSRPYALDSTTIDLC